MAWTVSRRCNLKCLRCPAGSENKEYPGELTMEQAVQMLDELADYKVPQIILSGGEPLMHPNFFELARYARMWGLRVTLFTNGTLITQDVANRLAALGLNSVQVSFDGLYNVNDRARGMDRAFRKAVGGLIRLKELGQPVGLRFALTRRNIETLGQIFEMVEREGFERIAFHKPGYIPWGRFLQEDDIPLEEERAAEETVIRKSRELQARGWKGQVRIVDDRQSGIARIDADGSVYPGWFPWEGTIGNVKERSFGDLWQSPAGGRSFDPQLSPGDESGRAHEEKGHAGDQQDTPVEPMD